MSESKITNQQRELLHLVTEQPDLVREAAHSGYGSRATHIAWVKERALAELAHTGPAAALASVLSDVRKHPETADPPAIVLSMMLAMNGHLSTHDQMREWITGIQ